MPKSEIKPFLHELESFMDSLKELENVTGRGELDWTKQAFRKAANMLFDARRDMDKEHNYRKISDQKHPKGNESVEQDMKERKRRQNEATATTTESSTTTKNESSTTTTMPESSPTTTESETTTIGEVVELSLTRYIITWSMVITQVNQSDIDSDTAADTIAEYCRNHNASFSLYPDMGTDAESVCSAMFAIKSSDGVFANHNVVKMAHMIAAYVKEHIEMGGVVADLSDEERDYKHDVLQHAALEIKAVLRFYVEKMRVNLEEQNGIERRELLDDPSEKMMRDMFDDLEYIEYGMWERNSSGQDTEMYMAAYEGVEVENATEAESRRKRDSNSSAIINRIHRPTTHVHQKIDLPSPKSSPLLQLVTSVKRLFIQLPARLRREVTTQEAQGGEGEEDNMWNDMIDADKCGSYDNWLTPGLVDTIGAYEPSLVYLKNSFMLRWIAGVPDEVQIVMIKDMIVEYLGEDWLSTDLYMFQKVEKAVKHHCSLMKHMLPENKCMKRSLSKLSLPCEQQRPKVIKMMTDYASRYCTGEEPKDETMQMLKNNFASMTNIVGCLVTDGKLDFMVDNETDFWQTTLGLQFQMVMVACDLETVLYQVNMHIEQHFNGSNDAMHSDVFKDVQFLTQIAKKLGSPLRCAAKAMYPYCAAKGADITDFANKFLPHLSMMTMGIATFDAKKMDFKTPKNFASKIRKAVMIFGDPHLVTLQSKDESDLQTCNELMSFANPETPLVSSEQSLLIANDFYKVWARMGKFAEDKTGTYLHEVVVDFLLHGKDVRKMTDETHNHMFFSTDGGLEPEFSFIDANDGGITKSQEKQVDKYGKGKTVHIEGTAAANGKNVITIKDDQSGTMMVISNPYGSVLSVLLRASEDLLGISSGLLIEGCMDSAERSEMTEDLEEGTDEEKARRKRNTDKCLEMCGGLSGTMLDTCLYDCMQAEGTAFQDAVADAAGDLEAIEQSAAQEDAALIETAEVEEIDEALMAPIATTMGAPAEFFFAEPEATTVLFEVNDDFTTPAFVQVAPLVMGENGSVVVPPVQTPEPKTTVPATLPPATIPPPATTPPTSTPPPPPVTETQPGPQTEPTTKPQTDPPTVFPNEFETPPIPGMLITDSIKPSTMAPPDSDLHNRKPAYVPQTGMKNYPTVRLAERVYNALDLTKRCEKNLLSHLTLGVCWSRLSG